ncbi:MAG TPA: S8 family serine peptidase [Verrucomicrobiae bacterium]
MRLIFAILALPLAMPAGWAAANYTLNWNTNQNRVTADIQSADLLPVLRRVAGATRWQILVEPGSSHTVSTKFKDLPPGEALRLLLGDLNFALVPGSNSPSRLFVFRTDREQATQLVTATEPQPGAKRIPNELIVVLKPGANIEDLAKKLGAKVVGRIDKLNAYRLRFEDEAAANAARDSLAANENVGSVDNNYSLDRPATPGDSQKRAVLPQLQMKPPAGSGRVIIGLVDTAVQSLGNNLDQFVLKQISVAGPSQLEPGVPSHGTAMAETMLGGLQQATGGSTSVQILPVDVYGAGESTSTFDVAFGIVQAVNGGARIVNLSLGSPGDNLVLRDVVRQASDAGILLIGAAGNTPVTTPFYPAAYPEVYAVTAIEQGQIAPYANRGSFISLGAPGLNLISYDNTSYGVQGTSVSSAILSGLAAGFMDANRATTAQARTFLQSNFGIRITPRP